MALRTESVRASAWMLPPDRGRIVIRWISPRRFSALYLGAVLIIVFSIWVPDTFLTSTTLKVLLAQQAVTGIIALGLTIALASGVLDLSVAASLAFSGMVAAIASAEYGISTPLAVLIGGAAGGVIGLVNGSLISGVGVSPIIATLGTSSVLSGLIVAISGNQHIVGLDESFLELGSSSLVGIATSFWVMCAIALLLWFALEHTPTGRYLRATGSGLEAARLTGVRVTRYIMLGAVVSSVVAGIAGMLATARIGAGDPSLGPPYLLAAFAASFLGSTQVQPGRFNIFGTLIAVYVLAVGVQGLQLAGAPVWLPGVFNGTALLLAVGLTSHGTWASAIRTKVSRSQTNRHDAHG
jgi:ribose transport system permease protein